MSRVLNEVQVIRCKVRAGKVPEGIPSQKENRGVRQPNARRCAGNANNQLTPPRSFLEYANAYINTKRIAAIQILRYGNPGFQGDTEIRSFLDWFYEDTVSAYRK